MPKTLQLHATDVYNLTANAASRIIVHQGGTSSGKTWSILQYLLVKALTGKHHISICAVTLPHLKKGAIRDFTQMLTQYGMYEEKYHNKTDNIMYIGRFGSTVEFFSLDQPGKARGPRRDILFVNECNLVPFDTFYQLMLRTRGHVFIDYNPIDENHWIYEKVLNRPDVNFFQSTYLSNAFLEADIKAEIERLREIDENYWKVYGLGERGQLKHTIYPPWQMVDTLPEDGDVFYGLDFGYNVPATALVKCCLKDGILLWVEELLYQSYLTNAQLIEQLKILLPPRALIYADAAEPQRITEIRNAGFNIKSANKSVKDGIDRLKRMHVSLTRSSTNIMKERQGYKWKSDSANNLIDEPVKFNDHAMDAIRYAVHTHTLKPTGKYVIR